MGKGGGSAPAAPDYASLINQQGNVNLGAFNQQLGAGRINASNPYGSSGWTAPPGFWGGGSTSTGAGGSPATPGRGATSTAAGASTFSPGEMLAGLTPGAGGTTPSAAAPTGGGTTSGNGVYGAPTGPWTQNSAFSAPVANIVNPALSKSSAALGTFDPSKNPTFNPAGVGQAFYQSEMGLLDPTLKSQMSNLTDTLGAEGFDSTGGTAGGAQSAINNLQNQQSQIRTQAASNAVAQEIPQGAQALAAQQSVQNQPLQQAQALESIGTAPSSLLPGGAAQTAALPSVDVLGSTQQGYSNAMGGYNAQQANATNQQNGLFGLLGSGALAYAML